MLATRTPWPTFGAIIGVPAWVWLGGLIGVFVVLVSVVAVPRLGVASYAVFVIAGQLGASALYDRTGLFGNAVREFTPMNMLGLMLVFIGAVLATIRTP
jgi:transporter family-2 protein